MHTICLLECWLSCTFENGQMTTKASPRNELLMTLSLLARNNVLCCLKLTHISSSHDSNLISACCGSEMIKRGEVYLRWRRLFVSLCRWMNAIIESSFLSSSEYKELSRKGINYCTFLWCDRKRIYSNWFRVFVLEKRINFEMRIIVVRRQEVD
jgi:hypothetical protein